MILRERLTTIKKLTHVCLIYNGSNKKIVQQYGDILDKNMEETYLNLENIIQVIDLLYDNFTQKIKDNFPKLSKREIQLCALIKADFQVNEIAALMSNQEDSIRTMKVRLRTKMMFSCQDEFISYIQNL